MCFLRRLYTKNEYFTSYLCMLANNVFGQVGMSKYFEKKKHFEKILLKVDQIKKFTTLIFLSK